MEYIKHPENEYIKKKKTLL